MRVSVKAAQIEAMAEHLHGSDVTDGDEVQIETHAGGNVTMRVVDSRGGAVDEVEFDREGEA